MRAGDIVHPTKTSCLQCPLEVTFAYFDENTDILHQKFSELVALVHHYKNKAEIMKKMAESATFGDAGA